MIALSSAKSVPLEIQKVDLSAFEVFRVQSTSGAILTDEISVGSVCFDLSELVLFARGMS
jgi:hypothetical protein